MLNFQGIGIEAVMQKCTDKRVRLIVQQPQGLRRSKLPPSYLRNRAAAAASSASVEGGGGAAEGSSSIQAMSPPAVRVSHTNGTT